MGPHEFYPSNCVYSFIQAWGGFPPKSMDHPKLFLERQKSEEEEGSMLPCAIVRKTDLLVCSGVFYFWSKYTWVLPLGDVILGMEYHFILAKSVSSVPWVGSGKWTPTSLAILSFASLLKSVFHRQLNISLAQFNRLHSSILGILLLLPPHRIKRLHSPFQSFV